MLASFAATDQFGDPLAGLTPTFRVYTDGGGVDHAQPSIIELGGGTYGFLPDSTTAARIYQVDLGSTALPRYAVGVANNSDIVAFGTYDPATGAPLAGNPAFTVYVDATGSAQTRPTITETDVAAVYFFDPSSPDITAGRSWSLATDHASQTTAPTRYSGTVGNFNSVDPNPPVVTLISAPTDAQTPFHFTVTDDSSTFRRIIVALRCDALQLQEVIHDGDTFGPQYTADSTRSTIANGFEYSCLRRLGWPPGVLNIDVYAIDDSGNEA